ncbi:hypothetical protein KR009_001735 [Drosophila setifemur]|nr:hypothetical protein KR009_001735 [Drosophila setifemur]
MPTQLLSLRFTVALILSIGAQWSDARPDNPYYVETGGQGHSHHQHHGHHGHGHGSQLPPLVYYPKFPDNQPPTFGSGGHHPGGPIGNLQPGFGRPQPGQNFGPQPGLGFPPHRNPNWGQQGRPGGGFNQGQPGFVHPGGTFNHGQPGQRQPEGSFNQGQPGFQQPGGNFNRGQPGFQQPGGNFNQGQPGQRQPEGNFNRGQPGFQQPEGNFNRGQSGLPSSDYPRPGQSPRFPETGNRPQSGENDLPTYPRPGGFQPSGSDENRGPQGFPQPGRDSSSGSPQPGNNQQAGGNNLPTYPLPGQTPGGFQQPGNGEHTIQPRPHQPGFQQPKLPYPGLSESPTQDQQPGNSNTFQPRPGNVEDFSQFNFQTPQTLQPRPGQDQVGEGTGVGKTIQPIPGQQQPSVIQPIPGRNSSPDSVDSNLGNIFNTQDYMSPDLASGSHRDPKSDAEDVNPDSVNERNLFETLPVCKKGASLQAGRCRYPV